MAKYKRVDSSLLSGKVGGLVYKQNANGSYVQPYRKKRATKVSSQQYINQFTTLATHWRTLTDMEQYTWEAARFQFPKFKRGSDPIYLTRKQLYMSHGAILMTYCGYTIDTLPRVAPAPAPIVPVSVVFAMSRTFSSKRLVFDVNFLNGTRNVPPDHILVIKASVTTPWVSGEGPSLPCTEFTTMNAGSLPGINNLWFDYEAKFVPLKVNDLVWFEFFTVHVLSGQVSKFVRLKVYITT